MHKPWFSLSSGKRRGAESSLGMVGDETQAEPSASPHDRLRRVEADGAGSTVGVGVGTC